MILFFFDQYLLLKIRFFEKKIILLREFYKNLAKGA